ncbi:hypothetical protein PtB15_6B272 [Puccinia triticina]|nr:hypothetical protein PtB15_6B272 [Puccinia triticina]
MAVQVNHASFCDLPVTTAVLPLKSSSAFDQLASTDIFPCYWDLVTKCNVIFAMQQQAEVGQHTYMS